MVSVVNGTLTPAFSPTVYQYVLSVPYLTTSFVVISSNTSSSIGGALSVIHNNDTAIPLSSGVASSPIGLAVGHDVITVYVLAQDGVTSSEMDIGHVVWHKRKDRRTSRDLIRLRDNDQSQDCQEKAFRGNVERRSHRGGDGVAEET